jgi:hypothetical protein
MTNRHVFTGHDEQDVPVLAAMELHLREKQVTFLLFPRQGLDEAFAKRLHEDWTAGKELEFPMEPTRVEHSAEEESLLPMSIKADQPELIRRVQNEWTLKLLSFKLYESINNEVSSMQGNLEELAGYSQELWDKVKKTWDTVGNHAQDYNLSKKHTSELRDRINGLFTELKKRRDAGQDELAEASAALKVRYEQSIKDIQESAAGGKDRVNQLFDQLKRLQKEIKDASMTHRDRRTLWGKLDGAFTQLKTEKQHLWHSHLANRIAGLERAVNGMQGSIDRDRGNIDWESRKLEGGRIGQLEHQLRQTRLKVMEDRIRSKEEKLADMHRTLQSLKKKEASQRKAQEAKEAAAAEARAKKAEADAAKAQAAADSGAKEGDASGEAAAEAPGATDDLLAEAATAPKKEEAPKAKDDADGTQAVGKPAEPAESAKVADSTASNEEESQKEAPAKPAAEPERTAERAPEKPAAEDAKPEKPAASKAEPSAKAIPAEPAEAEATEEKDAVPSAEAEKSKDAEPGEQDGDGKADSGKA